MKTFLIDTGPLIAFIDARDAHHEWVTDQFGRIPPPLQTCEAVLAETFFLLRRYTAGPDALLKLLDRRIVTATFRLDEEISRVGRLLRRYADVPMSFADACLVRMSEIHSDSQLITLDGDFQIYRRNGRQVIPLSSPAR